MRINQNSMAINAYRNLSVNNGQLGKSLEKLSSGFRINRAADDAAGLVISQNLRAQVSGLKQASRNAQDGISVVQTAEGALNEVHTMLNRMRDLAVQAANTGANDATARDAAQSEINELASEITRISDKTEFGGKKLLDGSYAEQSTPGAATATGVFGGGGAGTDFSGGNSVSFNVVAGANPGVAVLLDQAYADDAAVQAAIETQLGADYSVSFAAGAVSITGDRSLFTSDAETIDLTAVAQLGTATASDGVAAAGYTVTASAPQFQIGANAGDTLSVNVADTDATALGVSTIDVTTDAGAAAAITALDTAISTVSTTRGDLGAKQNRFESVINSLNVTTENLVASESRIRDTDMASEMTQFTKSQILSQAATSMLAQANQVPQSVLSLLR